MVIYNTLFKGTLKKFSSAGENTIKLNTSKTLLLDFDGVILRNKSIEKHLIKKIEKFSQRYLKITNSDLASSINRQIYSTSGHTLIGLQNFGCPVSLRDFNDEIYNIDYHSLYQLNYDNKMENDILSLRKLKSWCDDRKIKIFIFSNSPDIWCRSFLDLMSSEFKNIEILNNFNSSFFLKPQDSFYNYIEKIINTDLIYFVDDKWINFNPVFSKNKWVNIFFSDQCHKLNDKMYIVSELLHVPDILDMK